MRRILLPFAFLLLLAGCGTPAPVRLRLTLHTADPAQRTELIGAAQRVITSRLVRITEEKPAIAMTTEGSGALLSVTIADPKIADEITQEMLRPFSLMLMLKSTGSGGDIQVQNVGWFTKTDITEKEVTWVQSGQTTGRQSEVAIRFTADGQKRMEALFKGNQGRSIGLFVRGKLMSILPSTGKAPGENLMITGIPSPEIAAIFADDVNVGTLVTFSLP
ncbi:MAG: hypothetical protein WCG83_03620 [Candidatus Peregrinibacteria bacterium]